MATCPNKNTEAWQLLVASRGEDVAHYLWDKYDGLVPESQSGEQIVKSGLKATNILQSAKADQFFNAVAKNKISGDFFWRKMQADLGIPKDQIEILKSFDTQDKGELIASLLANYSFAIEINTATQQLPVDDQTRYYQDGNKYYSEDPYYGKQEISFEEYERYRPNLTANSQYYSNMTVPGGTNYTENEIATPAITPSIKGHAQFATDKGIGWFRSDEQFSTFKPTGRFREEFDENEGYLTIEEYDKQSKTRRILEVQSDLFQKGRDKEDLINTGKDLLDDNKFNIGKDEYRWKPYQTEDGDVADRFLKNGKEITQKEFFEAKNKVESVDPKANQFLQLLNQGSNWVTFFVKSIVQDSAKKGYEKVLFPSGNTASKVEGHTTLEDFKKQKEDRIKELENKEPWKGRIKKIDNAYIIEEFYNGKWVEMLEERYYSTEEQAKQYLKKFQNDYEYTTEINQLKQELARVEGPEGFGALKPIYNFYENTVKNVLNKQYGKENVKQVTDEYGNTWNEINIVPEREQQPIMLQLNEGPISSTASPKTLAMVNDFLTRIGVDTKTLKNVVIDGIKQDAAGAALFTQKLIQVVEGKEAQSLPEEAMHFAVAIIKQTNPALYKKLMSEVNSYAILNEVFATYGQNPMYQKDGKPDVIMLKEEAIAKVLAETIIKNNEGSLEKPENIAKIQNLWDQMVQWFKQLFTTSGFDQLSMDIITGKIIGTAEDINEEEGKAFLQLDPQEAVMNRIKEVSDSIEKHDEDGYRINGKKIPRVSDLVDAWYERTFRNGDLNKTEYQQAVFDLKAEKGTKGHKDLEYAFSLFVDENGYLRDTPLDDTGYQSRINPNNRDMYETLKNNLKDRLNSFPKGTRFMSEATIYNPKANRAGTVDFLAITPTGDVNILDWKFMDLDTDKYTDIPWYKNTAWNLQMEQYRSILQNAYGVKPEKFKQTRMIPIKALYSKGNAKENILPVLLGIKIGDVNVKNIKEDYLLPVPIKNEKTGKRKIDELLGELNSLYKKISDKSVPDSEKLNKDELLNSLFHSIRQLQVKENIQPLVRQAQLLNKTIEKLIARYEDQIKGQDAKSFSDKEVSNFAKEITDAQFSINIYTDLYSEVRALLSDSAEDEKLKKELRKTSEDAKDLQDELERVLEEYTEDIIAKREGIENFLSAEKVIKGFTKLFASTATLQSKAVQFLYKKANRAFAYSAQDTLAESKKLEDLKEKFEGWAKRKGLSYKNYFDILKKKDSNELIDEYDPSFYTELKAKTKEEVKNISDDRDSSWIRDNIDVPAYNEHLKEKLAEEIERIKNKPRLLTSEEADALANTGKLPNEVVMEIYKAKNLYDTSTTTSAGWFIYNETRKFPKKDKWTSEQWKELNKPENAPAKEFYDYIVEKNNEYADLGYINKRFARTFLPFVRKNLVEKLVTGGQVKLGQQFFTDISVDEGDIGYGQYDPDTGQIVNKIPKYFTSALEEETSTDLFRTMAMYNEAAIRYKYLTEIEDQLIAVVDVEKNKKSIATSIFGKTRIEDGVLKYTTDKHGQYIKGENANLVESMMKAIIYGQKFVDNQMFDQLLFKMGNWGETLNKKLGVNVFPEGLSNRQLSVNKTINQLNNTFQITTLGLNLLSATSNFFGGNAQSLINSGKYFTKKDYLAAELMIFSKKFLGTNQKKLIGALEYFLPLTDNYNRDIAKKLSLNQLTQESIQDFLMILMRNTDLNVQTANFYAFLNNSIVQDGQVINAREYLRSQPEYQEKYSGSVADRKAFEERFDAEVKRLINEKGVLKVGEVIDNKFVIPGVDQKSDSVVELRRKVQQVSKDALGNLSEDDLRMINMSVQGKSFMVFKNWIPRLVDVRMGNLKYNSASDAYEWGRTRMVFKVLTDEFSLTNPVSGLGKLYNSLRGTEKGVEYMRQMFEKKKNEYESETGKTLEMTETEFIDLARQNIKSQVVDVVFLATVFALLAALKANEPGDDEDPLVKNRYKFYVKAVDKFKGELMYFYDPTSGIDLISQGAFPAAAVITNFARLMINFKTEMFALGTGDEELEKKTQVIKYLMKTFPFTNQIQGYLPMFYPALAKDLGIKVQSNYGIR
jgi:hypothetical protein